MTKYSCQGVKESGLLTVNICSVRRWEPAQAGSPGQRHGRPTSVAK